MSANEYPFLSAVKMAFDQTVEKSKDSKVFWRLDNYVRGKANLVHTNSNIGDPTLSWNLLANNLINQYKWGGIRQFDIYFKQSPTDPDAKLFPLDLTNEQALKGMAKTGIAGFGENQTDYFNGIGGIGNLFQLMSEKHQAETDRRIAELQHKYELEQARSSKPALERFCETIERFFDKPGVAEKIADKICGNSEPAGGERKSDNSTQGSDDGVDFNPGIYQKMQELGLAAINFGLDYNPAIEATITLKDVPMVDNPGELLKGVAEFIKNNPGEAMKLWQSMGQNAAA